MNNTEKNESYPSENDGMRCDLPERALIRRIDSQCTFSALIHDMPDYREELLEIRELILDVLTSKRSVIRICGESRPLEVVKNRFMKLTTEHIRYVLSCLSENTTEVKNIRQYLLAALYNAPSTISSYYRAKVNHDMKGSC